MKCVLRQILLQNTPLWSKIRIELLRGDRMPNVVDKYSPTYDLDSFKQSKFEIKHSALLGAAALGFGRAEIHEAIQSMQKKHFYKSMTSYQNHRLWQDVYHVPYQGMLLYVKFTQGTITDFALLSFKEK